MARQQHTIIIRFIAAQGSPYRLHLEGPDVDEHSGSFTPPYDPAPLAC